MVNKEGNIPTGDMIKEPTVERDMHMAEAGEASGAAGQRLGKTTCVSFVAASE